MTEKFELASIDIETLSVRPDAVILSIGAVAFHPGMTIAEYELDDRQIFRAEIDVSDAVRSGAQIDVDTIKWWVQQSDEARQSAFFGAEPLIDALAKFADWVNDALTSDYMIVCNDIDFDKQIVHESYVRTGHPNMSPFRFGNGRRALSLPTMEWLIKNILGVELQYHAPTVAHDCVADAIAQARRAQQVLGVLDHIKYALSDNDDHSSQFMEWLGVSQFETFCDKTTITLGEPDDEEAASVEEADAGREPCEEESHRSDVGGS